MVILEEPHHGVQFGIRHTGSTIVVPLRDGTGHQIRVGNNAVPVTVPMRSRHGDVVRVAALRDALQAARAAHPDAVDQTGSGAFAISVLDPPWRQHFEGTVDNADTGAPDTSLNQTFILVSQIVQQPIVLSSVKTVLGAG
jgi:hypothetical protein